MCLFILFYCSILFFIKNDFPFKCSHIFVFVCLCCRCAAASGVRSALGGSWWVMRSLCTVAACFITDLILLCCIRLYPNILYRQHLLNIASLFHIAVIYSVWIMMHSICHTTFLFLLINWSANELWKQDLTCHRPPEDTELYDATTEDSG